MDTLLSDCAVVGRGQFRLSVCTNLVRNHAGVNWRHRRLPESQHSDADALRLDTEQDRGHADDDRRIRAAPIMA
jgi:hypothetical protein